MGMFGKLLGAMIDVAMVPVEVVKDVATLGGSVVGEDETFTGKRLKRVGNKIDKAADDAADGDLL